MKELEQTLPEETPETIAQAEGIASDLPTDAQAQQPETPLDITMGDMETDLPAAHGSAGSSGDAASSDEMNLPSATDSSDTDASPEIEIPWGDMSLPAAEEEQEETEQTEETGSAEEITAPVATEPAALESGLNLRRVWYVVHCYSGYENKVKKGLEQRINSMTLQDRIFRVVVPVEREVEIREGQRKQIERRVFPGYILVEMLELVEGIPSSDEVWYAVRNTPGVTGFVSSGDLQRPVPLRQEEVDKILKRMESEEPKVHVTFRVGQTVHIIDGPFADFRGNVDAVDMVKGKVRVLVSFFGRETPVELDLLQVEKV